MINAIQRMKIVKMSDNILKMTPNIDTKNLEIAFVFDADEDMDYLKAMTQDIIKILKQHSEVYRNVRTNAIYWKSDECIIKEVVPMPILQMGRYFDEKVSDEKENMSEKTWDEITRQLKLFYARAKIIFLIGQGEYKTLDENAVKENLSPFLKRKMLIVTEEDVVKL